MSEPDRPLPPNPPVPVVPLPATVRWLLQGLAVLSLLLGLIGIFVPVLPTVPFILLSAWAAARSSPRLLAWLENHNAFGPMLNDWRRGGVVRRGAKWASTLFMSAGAVFMLLTVPSRWAVLLAIACVAAVLVWLWQRPEHFPDDTAPPDR
jgi:uncharacterized membrane protein YbaN (DUF454 family)